MRSFVCKVNCFANKQNYAGEKPSSIAYKLGYAFWKGYLPTINVLLYMDRYARTEGVSPL